MAGHSGPLDGSDPIALRCFTEPTDPVAKKSSRPLPPWPKTVLAIDFETTTDETQRMLFGSYRYLRIKGYGQLEITCVEEGLIYAADLPESDLATLREYAASRKAEVPEGFDATLHLRPLDEFLEHVFWRAAAKNPPREQVEQPAVVVGFNLPFDLSRVAYAVGTARGGRIKKDRRRSQMGGGFSFSLFRYPDEDGQLKPNQYRPRLSVKTIDSKRHLMGLVRSSEIDESKFFNAGFRGHFLDLRTLAFALTDRSWSLKAACEEWGISHPKTEANEHGVVTPEYIDYNRRDVEATAELYGKLIEDFRSHPIELQPSKAFSPASIGKAYLKAMGIAPILKRQPDFPKEVLGHAMAAYYGGRAECRIRRTPVPVTYLDFLSMYPTVNGLMGLWDLVCAERVEVVDATDEVRELLETIDLDQCFDADRWPGFVGIVEIEPDGDILPVRARYSHSPNPSWQIGVNPLTSPQPLWYSVPDAIASKLLSGRPPKVIRAIHFEPVGKLDGLTPTRLRSKIGIDPSGTDFFRSVIEERKRLKSDDDGLSRFLKVLANAASYGIYAEMIRHELPEGQTEDLTIYGLDDPFIDSVRAPEAPGEYCFPPMAALITGAARLMLALLEACVTEAGGTYAFCDTDSMAIVSTETGGLAPCPGGPRRMADGADAVDALSWAEVDEIQARFASLNPYGDAVAGSVLEIEDENYEDKARTRRRPIYCFAISAKRYVLYSLDENGEPQLRKSGDDDPWQGEKWSEHGLGHLLSPIDPKSEDRDWIRELWDFLLRSELGLVPDEPDWLDRPALGQLNVSKPHTHRAFRSYNDGRAYADQVKPFNFMLAAFPAHFGHPAGVEASAFQLIAPFEDDRSRWSAMGWINRERPGETFEARTNGVPSTGVAVIKSYRTVLREYLIHPEAKSLAPGGGRSGWHTAGLLERRAVVTEDVAYIGKEANELDDSLAGQIHDEESVLNTYGSGAEDWEATLPLLAEIPRKWLSEQLGIDRSSIHRYLAGGSRPRPQRQRQLRELAEDWHRTT